MPDFKYIAKAAQVRASAWKDSDYFMLAESSMQRHWEHYIAPLIGVLNLSTVVEIGCGHGSNTDRLSRLADQTICTDTSQECIEYCRTRFKGVQGVKPVLTNGYDLSAIKSASATLVYSFGSMVHSEPEVVEAYVAEAARILKANGAALFHVSNWTGGYGHDFRTQPHWRNFMSQDLMKYFAKRNGLTIEFARVVSWDESLGTEIGELNHLDCLYILKKA